MTIQIIRKASLGLEPGAIRTLDASTEAALIADKEAISIAAPNPPGDEEVVRYDPTTGNLIGARRQILSSVSGALKVCEMPAEMAWPAGIARPTAYGSGDRWTCSLSPEDLIDTTGIAQTYFVDRSGGNNANTGLSWAQRKASITSAITAAAASGLPSRIMVYAPSGPYPRFSGFNTDNGVRTFAARTIIESLEGTVIAGTFDDLAWTPHATLANVYQATRSNAAACADPSKLDEFGAPRQYQWVTADTDVALGRGRWYTNNVTCYVRTFDDEPPSMANCLIPLAGASGFEIRGNKDVLTRGFRFFGGQYGAARVLDCPDSRFVFDNCDFGFAAFQNLNITPGGTSVDGLVIRDCQLTAAYNCRAVRNTKDGFNPHANAGKVPAVLTVNCIGALNGAGSSVSNNGLTGHDGGWIIDIGGTYLANRGTGVGFVDGTQAWCVGTVAGRSVGDLPNGGNISWGAFGLWSSTEQGRLWLEHCRDEGSEWGVYSDGTGQVLTRGHRGTGRRSASVLTA